MAPAARAIDRRVPARRSAAPCCPTCRTASPRAMGRTSPRCRRSQRAAPRWWSASIAAPPPATGWPAWTASPTSSCSTTTRAKARRRAILATVNPNRLDCTSGLGHLVRRRDRVPDRGRLRAGAAPRRLLRRPRRARPDGAARPGGAGDGVRRDAADRAQPRAGGAGAEGDGAARAAGDRGAARCRPGARPARRDDARLRARAAHQCGRADQRGRSRPAPVAVRRPGRGARRSRRRSTRSTGSASRSRQAMLEAAMRAAAAQVAAGHAAVLVRGRRMAPRRGRHRRRPDQGAVQPPGLRRRLCRTGWQRARAARCPGSIWAPR